MFYATRYTTRHLVLFFRVIALLALFSLSLWGCGGSTVENPTNLRIDVVDMEAKSYKVSWDFTPSVYWYQLRESVLDHPETPAVLLTMQPHNSEKTFTGKPANTIYSYQIRLVQLDVNNQPHEVTDWSSAVTFNTGAFTNAPAPPTDVKATVGSNSQVTVTWKAPVGSIVENYRVEQQRKESTWGDWTVLASSHTASPYTHTVAATGLYRYQIFACNILNGCSLTAGGSNEVTLTVNETVTTAPLPTVATDPDPSAQGDEIGSIAGSFRVNESGAATYEVPIFAIPGTAGVTPEISLSYSSQNAGGVVGLGWSIGGLSAISRCRQTVASDTQSLAATMSATDRLCLDGQKLVAFSGTYWTTGTEYRTEIESYARVYQRVSSGITYFEVTRKDGSTSYYGVSPTSGVTGTDALQAVRVNGVEQSETQLHNVQTWAIKQMADSVGNKMVFQYVDDADGQRIDNVLYAYAPSTTSNAKIHFDYIDRTDDTSGYVGGYKLKTNKLLNRIESYNGSTVVRAYRLTYQTRTDNLKALRTLEECSAITGGTCLKPTTFDWLTTPSGFANGTDQSNLIPTDDKLNAQAADINGDGLMDLVYATRDLAGGDHQYRITWAKSDGEKLIPQTQDQFAQWTQAPSAWFVVDYDGDGDLDLIHRNSGEWNWASNTGTEFGNTVALSAIPAEAKANTVMLDVNSDGLPDLLYGRDNNTYAMRKMKRVATNVNGHTQWRTEFDSSNEVDLTVPINTYLPIGDTAYIQFLVAWGTYQGFATPLMADFNGDGNVDLVVKAPSVIHYACTAIGSCNTSLSEAKHMLIVLAGKSSGGFAPYAVIDDLPQSLNLNDLKSSDLMPVDINADGLSDLLYKDRSDADQWKVYISKGAGRFAMAQNLGTLTDAEAITLTDYNHDGYVDFLYPEGSVLKARLYNAATEIFDTGIATNIAFSSKTEDSYVFLDLNGDGHASCVRSRVPNAGNAVADYADLTIQKSNADLSLTWQPANVMTRIDNGMGNVTSLAYAPLTLQKVLDWPLVYTKENDASHTSWYVGDSSTHEGWVNADNDSLVKPETDPVFDMENPTYVVWRVESSAPTASLWTPGNVDNTATSHIWYTYEGMKVQASGRGGLGFHRITTLDEQAKLKTTTTYRQDFPFSGMPEATEVKRVLSATNEQLLSKSVNRYTFQNFNNGHTVKPFRVVTQKVEDTQYDYDTGVELSLIRTSYIDTDNSSSYDAWGNVERMVVETFAGGNNTTAISTVTTVNQYGTTDATKEKGRLSSVAVTHARSDVEPPLTRNSSFTYYTSGTTLGLLKDEIIEPNEVLKLTTSYEYDSFGNKKKISQSGRSGKDVTSAIQTRYQGFTYDTTGRFIDKTTVAAPSGEFTTQTVVSRNTFGQPLEVKDLDGVSTKFKYGVLGRQYHQYSATGSYETKDYLTYPDNTYTCGTGTVFIEAVKSGGKPTTYSCFDKLGRVKSQGVEGFDGTYILTETEYDNAGRVQRVSEPYFANSGTTTTWTTTLYKDIARPDTITHPDNTQTHFTYGLYNNNKERTTTVTNAKQQTTTEYRNALGEVVRVVDHNQSSVSYFFDAMGNLLLTQSRTLWTDSNAAAETIMGYDIFGRKDVLEDDDKGSWKYDYNAFGELVEQRDAKLQKSLMTYDVLGRMTTRKDYDSANSAQTDTSWTYDANTHKGKLTEVFINTAEGDLALSSHRTVLNYDGMKRPSGQDITIDGTTTYKTKTTYDEYGRVFQQFDASGRSRGTWSVYNNHGYLKDTNEAAKINGATTTYHTVTERSARGQLKKLLLQNGYTISQSYVDATGLISAIRTSNAANNQVQMLTYQWDTVGNLIHRWDEQRQQYEAFCYDQMNRLVDAGRVMTLDCTGLSHTNAEYRYDGLGNITQKTGVNYAYAKTGNAGPHAVTSVGSATYSYDSNGNVIDDSQRTYSYTTFDQAYKIKKTNTTTEVQFWYGADRGRYKQVSSDGKTTHYVGNVEFIIQAGQTEVKRTVSDFILVSEVRVGAVTISNKTQYTLRDHVNSVSAVMEGDTVVNTMSFDSWGQRRDNTNWNTVWDYSANSSSILPLTALTTRGYTGHEMLDLVGIIHMNGRIYDPKIGRFLQADPIIQDPQDTQSYNRYSYVRNNPLKYTDPSGFSWWGEHVTKRVKGVIGSLMQIAGSILVATGVGAPLGYGLIVAGGALSGYAQGNILKGVAIAAFSAFTFNQIGMAFDAGSGFYATNGLAHIAAHAIAGGAISVLQGGKFGHGFVSAGILKSVTPSISGMRGGIPVRTLAASVLSGTISRATGGKFANGAVSGAYAYAFNEVMSHAIANAEQLPTSRRGYKTYGDREKQYAKDSTVRSVEALGERWDAANPDEPDIQIGNMSKRDGSAFGGHSSHRTGVDVDIRPMRNDGQYEGVNINSSSYDRDSTQLLVNTIRKDPAVQLIYFNDNKVTGVQNWEGHDDHLHVRYSY